jgi:hypothetical protein
MTKVYYHSAILDDLNVFTIQRYLMTKMYSSLKDVMCSFSNSKQGRRRHDCMVVEFTTTCAISAYHH